jgi:D-3-phosphoglycerate dehydrogenase
LFFFGMGLFPPAKTHRAARNCPTPDPSGETLFLYQTQVASDSHLAHTELLRSVSEGDRAAASQFAKQPSNTFFLRQTDHRSNIVPLPTYLSINKGVPVGIQPPSNPFRILAAGDRFIAPSLFAREVIARLGGRVQVSEMELPWPDEAFHAVAEVNEASGDEESLIKALDGVHGIVTQLAPLTERVLDSSPDLQFIGVSRGGPTNVNVEAALSRGITVTNVPGRNGIATAEMTLGLILAVVRRIPLTQATLASHQWRGDFYRKDEVGLEISGTTVGVIGAGAVGKHVAMVLAAMGADVLVFDPYSAPGALDGIGTLVPDLDDLFRRSSLVTVHARLTAETANIISADRIALMPRGSYIVNSARGGLLDYAAVAVSLRSGQLAGAAFDVFPTEPVDFSHPLFELLGNGFNVVVTPHIAGASHQTAVRAASGTAEELLRYLDGRPPLNALAGASAKVTQP